MPSSGSEVSDADRVILESWTRSSTVSAGRVERARNVLSVVGGVGTAGTVRAVGVSRPTMIKWRDRFATHGMAGLGDEVRSGRPKTVEAAAIIAATLDPPPQALGVAHWSSRLLGRRLGVGDATVAWAWRKYRVQSWRRETFKFSTDLELEAKVRFLKEVANAYPRRELHVVLDDYHTHKYAEINDWLPRHPRITLHFTPTSGSWLNLVEVFLGIIARQAIRRGSFDSVKQLVTAIGTFIEGWNDHCHPFSWTKAADEILPHATRKLDSDARH
jgi:hypothetical protein